MKLLLIIGLIAVISTSVVSARHPHKGSRTDVSSENGKPNEEPPNKVKLVRATAFADPEYFGDSNFQTDVVEVNSTYSGLGTDYKIIKDFPVDTLYSVQVYRAEKGSDEYEHTQDIKFYFCKDLGSKYFEYLPDVIANEAETGKCLPKGFQYKSRDTPYLRFYDLLSVEDLENAKFKTIKTLEHGNKILYSLQLDFESNY